MCKSLKTVIFPASVETIEGGAFSYCSNLSDVYCYAENVPSLDNYSFYEVNLNNATLHVLAKSLTTYQGTDPWSQFGKIVPLTENEITGIELPNVDESLYNSKNILFMTLRDVAWKHYNLVSTLSA